MTDLSKSASPSEPRPAKMVGCEALRNGNEHFGIHDRNNFCEQRGCVAEPRRDEREALTEFKKSVDNAVTVAFLSMTEEFGATDPREAIEHIRREFRDAEMKFQQTIRVAARASAAPLKQTLENPCEDCEEREATWETSDEVSLCSECVTKRASLPQPSAGQTEGK